VIFDDYPLEALFHLPESVRSCKGVDPAPLVYTATSRRLRVGWFSFQPCDFQRSTNTYSNRISWLL